MIRDFPTPPTLAGDARRWTGADRPAATTPREAATVLLVDDADGGGVEVFMLHRRSSMAFAAGMSVFPGGGVDPADATAHLPWAGPDAAAWGEVLGADPAAAQALVCAAVRETFEECGVLLAGRDAGSVVEDVSGEDWEVDRRALVGHEVALSEVLTRRGLVLRSDLLRVWAHWITPEFEPRRYDTRFFLAALPPGQRARHVGEEAHASGWAPAAEVLAAGARGDVALMPPTLVCLEELAAAGSVADLLGAAREVTTVVPWLEDTVDGDGVRLRARLSADDGSSS